MKHGNMWKIIEEVQIFSIVAAAINVQNEDHLIIIIIIKNKDNKRPQVSKKFRKKHCTTTLIERGDSGFEKSRLKTKR